MDVIARIIASDQVTGVFLTALATALAAVLGWIGVEFRKVVLNQRSASELDLLLRIGANAVRYVEQTMPKAKPDEKFAEASRVARSFTAAYGVKVDDDRMRAIIESAVYSDLANVQLPTPPSDGG